MEHDDPAAAGMARLTAGRGWQPKYLVKIVVGPEMALDQPYWEVLQTWKKKLEPWGAKSRYRALFDWKHTKKLGTSITSVPQVGVTSSEATKAAAAIEAKVYETWDDAVDEVRERWATWKKKSDASWTSWAPDRGGSAAYVIVGRGPHDPERRSVARSLARKGQKVTKPLGWRVVLKFDPERTMGLIMKHLSDGEPRTFNRIGVEMLDMTADHLFQTPFEDAIWLGVERGYIEYANWAPLLFRLTPKGKKAVKGGGAHKNPGGIALPNVKVPSKVQAQKQAASQAKKLVGIAPHRVEGEITSKSLGDISYASGSFVASYSIGAQSGAHVGLAWSDMSGWEVRTLGFGFNKLTVKAKEAVKPVLDKAGVKPEPFRIGQDWTNSQGDSGLTFDAYAKQVFTPVVKALGKKGR